ncbi:MAG TPA: MFS transporter [Clostridiaceae bacterium]|nr:MFS transporter [Clostridiaceae bacterium]
MLRGRFRLTERWQRVNLAFLGGQAASLLGSGLVQFAIIWYVTLEANSGTSMMIITLASFVPQLLIAPFSGVWADRYDRRWLIILADGGIALATLALAVLFLLGYDHIWIIYVAAIIRSLGGGIQGPAINAFVPQITPKRELLRVNGINTTINNVTSLLSPILGGTLLTLFPLWVVFMVDVGTAAIAIIIMFFLPVPDQKTGKVTTALGTEPKLREGDVWGFPTPDDDGPEEVTKVADEEVGVTKETIGKQFRKGFSYVRKHRSIKNLMLTYAFFMVLLAPVAILTPLFIRRTFGEDVWRISASQTALFAGMAVGGLIVSIRGRFRSHLQVVRTSGFSVAALTLFLAILGMIPSPKFFFLVVLAFALGTIVPFYTTAMTTLFQENVERSYHGRIFALLYMIGSAAIPLGTVVFGPMADLFDMAHVLLATSVAQLLLLLTTFKTIPVNFESGVLIPDDPSPKKDDRDATDTADDSDDDGIADNKEVTGNTTDDGNDRNTSDTVDDRNTSDTEKEEDIGNHISVTYTDNSFYNGKDGDTGDDNNDDGVNNNGGGV